MKEGGVKPPPFLVFCLPSTLSVDLDVCDGDDGVGVLGREMLDLGRRAILPSSRYLRIDSPTEQVYAYLRANFKDDLGLDRLARIANQNPSSLCRSFKARTGKTIRSVLNEIRIKHACRLLTPSDYTRHLIPRGGK